MKLSYNTHDIYALVSELKSWIGYRVLNIYDIDSKTLCIKFNSDKSEKKYLVIESGTKFYSLDNFSAIKDFPSSFSSKLRKHINNKRLESFTQINLDRVIDIQFGTNELAYHIIAEFYGSGNIIFTDYQYKILNLLHPHVYMNDNTNLNKENQSNQIKVCVGQIYPFDYATLNLELSVKNIKDMFESTLQSLDKKIKIKQIITKLPLIKYSSNVIEHALKSIQINLSDKISSQTKFEDLFESDEKVKNFIEIINQMFELDKFIGYRTNDNIYPFPYTHIDLTISNKYDSYSNCTSLFWSELKPLETKEQIKKKDNLIKLSKQEKAIWNIEQQIAGMENNINKIIFQIDILTENINLVQILIDNIKTNSLEQLKEKLKYIDDDINLKIKLIEILVEKKIIKLELDTNIFEINYSFSAWENREILYKKVKKIQEKQSNAIEILNKQKKLLQKINFNKKDLDNNVQDINININLQNFSNKYKIIGQSKPNWFEQFNWFYTSDELLFISGKTAEQNEQIVKRYMDNSDIYIHSEVFGSGSGIIKNPLKLNIPETNPSSLIEAGMFLIAHTKAWGTGVADSAYWVRPEQVSKTPETGEYLTKGSFIIRGQKNLIRVDKMEMGFGILFKVLGSDNFTSNPSYTEQIEYAIPILSTYTSIFNYKFKTKVIPGNQKIKKILQEVISNFNKKANFYEKEAIKKISNDSIQKVLINGMRFVVSK